MTPADGARPASKARALLVVLAALTLAVVAVRAMAFAAPRAHPLRALTAAFPGHPDALADSAMLAIGAAAARGQELPAEARRKIVRLSRRAPLAPEPFLVEGTIAQIDGDLERGERLFLAARTLDPRSAAARYFLADRYLRSGRIGDGLAELGALARLSPEASRPLIPALAAYAKSPGAVDQMRRLFEAAPETRGFLLSLLAEDPANARLVLALAGPWQPGTPPPDWPGKLVTAMVNAGDYSGAEQVWREVSGIGQRGLLFDPQFRSITAPRPFGWSLGSGSAGLAEPAEGGGLDIVYYGREPIALASQLLTLSPGRYRITMRIAGQAAGKGLAWIMTCIGASQPVAVVPLDRVAGNRVAGLVSIPATACPAQGLELRGQPVEGGGTVELTITDLALVRAGATG